MDNRERATQFVASLPKFEGMQRISPTDPERYKVYKDLIDKLEKEFNAVACLYIDAGFSVIRKAYGIPPMTSELYAKQIEAERREAGIP